MCVNLRLRLGSNYLSNLLPRQAILQVTLDEVILLLICPILSRCFWLSLTFNVVILCLFSRPRANCDRHFDPWLPKFLERPIEPLYFILTPSATPFCLITFTDFSGVCYLLAGVILSFPSSFDFSFLQWCHANYWLCICAAEHYWRVGFWWLSWR